MLRFISDLRHSLVSKLIITVGLTLMVAIATWSYFSIRYQQDRLKGEATIGADRLSSTIKLGTHYAMMLNSRDDINQIINNIARREDIENIRIYNKEGQIKFSNHPAEVEMVTNIKAEACDICHRSDPPLVKVDLAHRTRILDTDGKYRRFGIISPIYNEPGCSTSDCHFHPQDKKILGALDVVVSLEEIDKEILFFEQGIIGLALFVFVLASAMIFVFVMRFVKQPINSLVSWTRRISRGDFTTMPPIKSDDEVGQLAGVIHQMAGEIGRKQNELNRQKNEYQNLFETVPCLIAVVDREYKLIQYNSEFADRFGYQPGAHCFRVYKGRDEKCVVCPVEKTFEDGLSHTSEEAGFGKDGTPKHWLVKTSPIKNGAGDVVAAMEMNLDITQRRLLEQELENSEKKYHAIFNNIPNPVFVLDRETLEILDCNDSIKTVYGSDPGEVIQNSFLDLFMAEDRERVARNLKTATLINQVKQLDKSGKALFVNIRISPSEYPGRQVLLVTTSDITKRLEAEQQLIQASKMATLGEMATGVAHELNQPLSVIKTASSFFMRKVRNHQSIPEDILATMAQEIDSHVDRASKIINHMRQFGRKSELGLESVQVNDILARTFEIFSQQLTVRGIDVEWQLESELPLIMADTDRLEQVFINLLINARDSIMDRVEAGGRDRGEKKIFLQTRCQANKVVVEVCDTGVGVPPAIIDKIFEPFYTTKDVGKGTGLGLSISYGIVKDFGGSIHVRRNPPCGACFVIAFPVKPDP